MNGVLMTLLVLLAAATLAGFLYLRSPAYRRRLLRKAATLASAGRIDEMLALLRRNMNPASVADPLTNALVYYFIRSGDFSEAEKAVLEAMNRGDRSGMAVAQLAYIAAGRGDPQEAESLYRTAMEKDPPLRRTLLVNLAALLMEQGGDRLDEAEELLEQALELREGAARGGVHVNLALLHLKKNQPRDALIHAMTGYELQPTSEATRLGRAQALALAARASQILGEGAECSALAGRALDLASGIQGAEKLEEELRALAGRERGTGNPA